MKIIDYHEGLRCWRTDSGMCLNMPPETKEADVLAEAERLVTIMNTPPAPPPTLDELLDAAITEYVGNGGKPETVADVAVAKMAPSVASAYLDEKAVAVKPVPPPTEKPTVHIRRDEKLALCEYFLGPYTWAFADVKQAQQEIDVRGVVEICPKCMDIGKVG